MALTVTIVGEHGMARVGERPCRAEGRRMTAFMSARGPAFQLRCVEFQAAYRKGRKRRRKGKRVRADEPGG